MSFSQKREPFTHVKKIVLSGKNLRGSSDFKTHASKFDIKSMKASIFLNNVELKVNVFENGWIYFSKNYPLNICLGLAIYLK